MAGGARDIGLLGRGSKFRKDQAREDWKSLVEAAAQKEAEQGQAVGDGQKPSGLDGDQGRMIWDVLWKKTAVSQ